MRGDPDLHFYQCNPSLCEGNPLDLDFGKIGVLLLCSSSTIPPIIFVALVEFESEGLAIAFSASV